MILLLTGAPGAGKGTQADLLHERGRFRKFSTGDALRKHVKAGTEIGKQAGAVMERGELVPDDILFQILKAELDGVPREEVVLLDGYPRNIPQAETLATLEATHPVIGALHLDVPRDDLIARLSGRRVCGSCGTTFHVSENPPKKTGVCDKCGSALTQRNDDKPESVAVRLDVYEKNTRPILDFYEKTGLYVKVPGTGSRDTVYAALASAIDGLRARSKKGH
jgi:adenylate kinase